MNYNRYLQSKEWQELRKRKLKSVGNICEICEFPYELRVHHLTYERIGREKLSDLQVLCERCHTDNHYEPLNIPELRLAN